MKASEAVIEGEGKGGRTEQGVAREMGTKKRTGSDAAGPENLESAWRALGGWNAMEE